MENLTRYVLVWEVYLETQPKYFEMLKFLDISPLMLLISR